jgi:hydrogenase maturation factor
VHTEVADETLAIFSNRNRIMQKKELESACARWNEYLNRGLKKAD